MKFSNSHEWVELSDDIATVGITNYGRMHLGDIVNISLPEVNKYVKAQEEICIVESNKAAVDVHSPVSGKIIEVNESLIKDIKDLNVSPEEKGWLFKVQVSDKSEYDQLLSLDEYEKQVSQ
jgi:glycine cleavage system H protein